VGEPERSESSGEQQVPTRAKHLGSEEGHGFPGGSKPLERRGEVLGVLPGSAGTEREAREGFSITREEKSSGERSPGALGVERDPPGYGNQAISPRG
jgi:hypothetical protein